jgi:hypothetical protein
MRRHPHTVPSALAAPPPVDGDDALFSAVGPVEGLHVLVIGSDTLEVMCGLIRRGCAAAAEIALKDRPAGTEPADIAILPQLRSLTEAAGAVALAGRLVLPGGRLVLRDCTGRLAGAIAAVLPQHGFSTPRRFTDGRQVVLAAERPFFGPRLHPARPVPTRRHATRLLHA